MRAARLLSGEPLNNGIGSTSTAGEVTRPDRACVAKIKTPIGHRLAA
jgi:hypothetical protein